MARSTWFGVLLLVCGAARGEDLVRLDRWTEPARLVTNPGPGGDSFLITAEVDWSDAAPRGGLRYAAQLALPTGEIRMRRLDPGEGPGSSHVVFVIPAASVRNIRPEAIIVRATIVDGASGTPVGNELTAGIDEFPSGSTAPAAGDAGPFGGGTPLDANRRLLPRSGPDGSRYLRVPGGFLASTEATNTQVAARLPGYDPKAGRSDEFPLEAPEQPAIGLTPERAEAYLRAIGRHDASGPGFRLPTVDEWRTAARTGTDTTFWWGSEPPKSGEANFLGPEPALKTDATAPSAGGGFPANSWGLIHTFGNVAEWATDPSGGFVRMGGGFRTEPAAKPAEPKVADAKTLGPDPYVGVRPFFAVDDATGGAALAKRLTVDPALRGVNVRYDADHATAVLTGEVAEPGLRRRADDALKDVWWVAAIQNRLTTPRVAAGRLVDLGRPAAPPTRRAPLGRLIETTTVPVRWGASQPVDGSEWWVNATAADGRKTSHVLRGAQPGRSATIDIPLDRIALGTGPVSVVLSLGGPADSADDPRVVSEVLNIAATR